MRHIPTRPRRSGWGPRGELFWASGRVKRGERLAGSPKKVFSEHWASGRVKRGGVTLSLARSPKKVFSEHWASGRVKRGRATRPIAQESSPCAPTPSAWASGYVPDSLNVSGARGGCRVSAKQRRSKSAPFLPMAIFGNICRGFSRSPPPTLL